MAQVSFIKKNKNNINKIIFILFLLFLIQFNRIIFARDSTKQVQYRRTIEPTENQQSYEQKYFDKNLNEIKRSLFPLESTGIWTELNPNVPRVDYLGIDFVNKDTGWACGDLGALIKTTNGGADWTVSETNTTLPVLKVRSYNGQIVVASGFDGLILRSTDAGETFTQVTSSVTGDMWGLQMLNDTLGWACGTSNSLTKTTDGGQTWERIFTPGYVGSYWWIDFFENNVGYLACDNGLILTTSNGGNNWEQKQTGNNDPLFSINIIDSLHIAAVGANGKSVYSSDAGENWIENPSFTGWDLNCVYFVNIDTGYTIAENLNLRRTTNRGFTWESENLNVGEWEIQFLLEDNIGVATGNALKLYKTENGFENWIQLILNENFSDVHFISADIGFALGNNLYKTLDAGLTFIKQMNAPGGTCVVFVDSLVGYIGSSRCYIYKSIDAGNSWYRANRIGLNDTIGTINKIFFISHNIGWAITGRGGILKTTDSGENWFTQLNAGISVNFYSICFIDSLIGWTANTGARPFKTTDGGINWIQQTNLDIWQSRDVLFNGPLRGFLLESNELYQTTNGGVTFNLIPEITGYSVAGKFSSYEDSTIFITGYRTFRSLDSGNNWIDFPELTGSKITGLSLLGKGFGYASGELGLILLYNDTSVPVELTDFSSSITLNNVTLNWQTATETNNSGFQIERHETKKNRIEDWKNIGFVNGNGTTTEPQSYSFVDENLSAGKYQYRLKQTDFDGTFEYSNTIEVEISIPTRISLNQNFPNPFNPSTTISWQSPISGWQTIKLYNTLGEEVETIVNKYLEVGLHSKLYIVNSTLPSGVYFYKLTIGGNTQVRKMILTK